MKKKKTGFEKKDRFEKKKCRRKQKEEKNVNLNVKKSMSIVWQSQYNKIILSSENDRDTEKEDSDEKKSIEHASCSEPFDRGVTCRLWLWGNSFNGCISRCGSRHEHRGGQALKQTDRCGCDRWRGSHSQMGNLGSGDHSLLERTQGGI